MPQSIDESSLATQNRVKHIFNASKTQMHRLIGRGTFGATAVLAMALMAGCAVLNPSKPAPDAQATDASVSDKLARYAESASDSLRRLAEVERAARAPEHPVVPIEPIPGLDRPLALEWSGPLEGLVQRLAQVSAWTYVEPLGKKPSTTVLVTISVRSATATEILADAGVQAGVDADIVIRPAQRVLGVRYPGGGRNSGQPRKLLFDSQIEASGTARKSLTNNEFKILR
jgi:DotD protein